MTKPITGDQFSLNNTTKQLLLASMVVICLTLIKELSAWLIAFIALSVLWQIALLTQLSKTPHRLMKFLVSVAGLTLLLFSAKQLGILNAMVHLLVFGYLLKPLELQRRKDFYLLILLGFFVLITSLIYQQSLYFMLIVCIGFMLNFSVLMSVFNPKAPLGVLAKKTVVLLLSSIPLAAFLFLMFPKISPLWQMPSANVANTGISDRVKIGDIAKLALSNELAFRVEFADVVPTQNQLYWRGLVLDQFDGIEWSAPQFTRQVKTHLASQQQALVYQDKSQDEVVNYRVILEPSQQKWLFGLNQIEQATSEQVIIDKTYQYTLEANKKILNPTSYLVTSTLSNVVKVNLSVRQKQHYLAVTPGNERLIAKGAALQQQFTNPIDIIDQVLRDFNQQGYRYTLNPPPIAANSLDGFYFDTKSGFCEHYASSFTFLMRASGIPARVVVGYLGGELNEQAGYYGVYQRDAHAWSEVWLENKGWLRIDPTAAVHPDRVERGFNLSLGNEQALLNQDYFSFINSTLLFTTIRHYLDAFDYQWTKWIVNYSSTDQLTVKYQIEAFIAWLLNYLAIIFAGVVIIIVGYFSYRIIRRTRNENKALVLYQQLLLLMETLGLVSSAQTTLTDIKHFVDQSYPNLSMPLAAFIKYFHQILYDNQKLTKKERAKKLTELAKTLQQIRRLSASKR